MNLFVNRIIDWNSRFFQSFYVDVALGIFSPDQAVVKERQDELNEEYAALVGKAAERRAVLERSLELQLFLRNAEQQGSWIRDFVNVLMSSELGRDLTHALSLQEKHKVCSTTSLHELPIDTQEHPVFCRAS